MVHMGNCLSFFFLYSLFILLGLQIFFTSSALSLSLPLISWYCFHLLSISLFLFSPLSLLSFPPTRSRRWAARWPQAPLLPMMRWQPVAAPSLSPPSTWGPTTTRRQPGAVPPSTMRRWSGVAPSLSLPGAATADKASDGWCTRIRFWFWLLAPWQQDPLAPVLALRRPESAAATIGELGFCFFLFFSDFFLRVDDISTRMQKKKHYYMRVHHPHEKFAISAYLS